jgi:hypothetical protein
MSVLLIVTIISLAIALGMSVFAWRLAQEERRRSEARIEALASDISDEPPDPVELNEFMSDGTNRVRGNLAGALVIGSLFVGSAVGLAVLFAGGSDGGGGGAAVEAREPSPSNAPVSPLELLTLEHERIGGQLIVRGTVRTPEGAAPGALITAFVSLFDGGGEFVASGGAPLQDVELASGLNAGAGVESRFVVTVTGSRDVRRYRISFRAGDRTLPHMDRRDHEVSLRP